MPREDERLLDWREVSVRRKAQKKGNDIHYKRTDEVNKFGVRRNNQPQKNKGGTGRSSGISDNVFSMKTEVPE